MSQRDRGRRDQRIQPTRGAYGAKPGSLGGNSGGRVPRDQRVHVGDGLKQGLSQDVEGATEDELSPENQEALAQAMMRQMQMSQPAGWAPACCQCVSDQKVALIALQQKLVSSGIPPEDPRFAQAIQQAAQVGQMIAKGQTVPEGLPVIPAVRKADVLANGSSLCAVCFVPANQSKLLAASTSTLLAANAGNWR